MKIGIIIIDQKTYGTKRIVEEIINLKQQYELITPYNISSTELERKINICDCFIYRISPSFIDQAALDLIFYINKMNRLVFNNFNAIYLHRSKILQMSFYQNHGVKVPKTYSYTGEQNAEELRTWLQDLNTDDFVIKLDKSFKGKGVMFVHTNDSLFSALDLLTFEKVQRFLIQPYLHSFREYRFYFIDKELVQIVEKNKLSGVKGNYNDNDLQILIGPSLDTKFLDLGKKIHELSGLFYSAIDFILFKDELILLEVNSVPGFELLDNHSQFNFSKELVRKLTAEVG